MMKAPTDLDRLAMRTKPEGSPIMHQTWQNLLFLHWPIDPVLLRPLIPAALEIDTFDGKAWIGITPFGMSDVRLSSLPAIPGLDTLLELNVRTYVHHQGKPGVWFFSLDASKLIPVMAARVLFMLPYFKATMDFTENLGEFIFNSERTPGPTAKFQARWRTGIRLRDPAAESLTFFLVERYALFSGSNENLTMARIYHHPWILDEALVLAHESSMVSVLGLPEPETEPLAHFSRSLNVEIWEPKAV
jgi:uncharacterized protein YqjF (DUF2071 family)